MGASARAAGAASDTDAAANRAAHPEVAAWVDAVRQAFGDAKVVYFGPARPFARFRDAVPAPRRPLSRQETRTMHHKTAVARGHTTPIFAESAEHDLYGWASPDAAFDGIFQMTCSDTGDRLEVRGWLFEVTLEPDA